MAAILPGTQSIQAGDWPIDPYTVDGVELAARLNRAIPSEFQALSTGKANLAGGNSFTGNQKFAGSSYFQGEWSNSDWALRTIFLTTQQNGTTSLIAMPAGTGTGSGFTFCAQASTTQTAYLLLAQMPAECQIISSRVGSAAYTPMAFYCGGVQQMRLDIGGQCNIINDNGTYSGTIVLTNNGVNNRTFRVENATKNVEIINSANTVVTHRFSNNGDFVARGAITSQTADGGNGAMYAYKDGSGNYFTYITNAVAGGGAALAYYPGVTYTWMPSADQQLDLGRSSVRYVSVWAVNGTIQTSDAREKTPVRSLTTAELACALEIAGDTGIFQWLADINKDGEDGARMYVGQTAQRYIEIFDKHGLDALKYGMVRYDEWEASDDVVNEEGVVIIKGAPAGDRYSASYTDIAMFAMRGVVERQRTLEQRLAALEAKA